MSKRGSALKRAFNKAKEAVFTKRKWVLAMLLCSFLAVSMPKNVYGADDGFDSDGMTGFYGDYKAPETPEKVPSQKPTVSQPQAKTSKAEELPNAGDIDYLRLQTGGALLLLTGLMIIWQQKQRGE